MSITAMTWVWNVQVRPSAKLVLLALADHADEQGVCWPGVAGIARKCCLADRTVRRCLGQAEAAGLVYRQRRYTNAGRQISSLYRLRMEVTNHHSGVAQSPEEGGRSSSSMMTGGPEVGDRLSPKSSIQSSQKSSSIDDDDHRRRDDCLPVNTALVARIAERLAAGKVDADRLTGYVRVCLSGQGLSTDEATIRRHATAVLAHDAAAGHSKRRWLYPPELLDACEVAGIESVGPPSALATRLVAEGFLADRNTCTSDEGRL